MTARKASSTKKAGATKAPTKKAATKKKTGAKTPASKKATSAAAPAPEPPKEQKPAAKQTGSAAKAGASSMQVAMGHVFALRPRVTTSFRPDDFRRARQLLADESYASPQDAARAVAEKALELTHDGPGGVPKPKRY